MSSLHPKHGDGPDLSIIIVNKDRHALTLACIESIFHSHPNHTLEIILIDSSTGDTCAREAADRYPIVRVFRTPADQGFAQNYNQGMRHARGRIWLNLNNDTLVHPGALDALINAIDSSPTYGMVGPVLRGEKGEIQPACARQQLTFEQYLLTILLLDPGFVLGRWWYSRLSRKLETLGSGPIPCISGAAMAVPAEAARQFGMFDEGYQFYFEDIEWCHRMRKNGLQVGFIAEATITHFGDQTASSHRAWAKKNEYGGALRFFRNVYGVKKFGLFILWIATIVSYLERVVVFGVKKLAGREGGYFKEYSHLLAWIIKHPPDTMKD